MLKLLPIITVAIFLGGCASSASLRENAPTLRQKSLLSAKDVAVCVGEKWGKMQGYNAHASMMILKNGYAVELRGETGTVGTIFVADITDTPTGGSETSVYSYSHIFNPTPKRFPDAVISCQTN